MTREEYKEHLKDIIMMVFSAEQEADKLHHIIDKLKSKEITPDDYISMVADEILNHTPDKFINDKQLWQET